MMEVFETLGQAAKTILSTVAPIAASAFGGPLAGVAAQKIIGTLGLSPDTTIRELESALVGASPDQLLQLKKMEQDFKLDLKRLGIEEDKLVYQDRDSARNREIQTKDNTPQILAVIIIGLYVIVQVYLLMGVINVENEPLLLRSLGVLDTGLGLVLSYYFGSSLGSRQNQQALTDQLTKK